MLKITKIKHDLQKVTWLNYSCCKHHKLISKAKRQTGTWTKVHVSFKQLQFELHFLFLFNNLKIYVRAMVLPYSMSMQVVWGSVDSVIHNMIVII